MAPSFHSTTTLTTKRAIYRRREHTALLLSLRFISPAKQDGAASVNDTWIVTLELVLILSREVESAACVQWPGASFDRARSRTCVKCDDDTSQSSDKGRPCRRETTCTVRPRNEIHTGDVYPAVHHHERLHTYIEHPRAFGVSSARTVVVACAESFVVLHR